MSTWECTDLTQLDGLRSVDRVLAALHCGAIAREASELARLVELPHEFAWVPRLLRAATCILSPSLGGGL